MQKPLSDFSTSKYVLQLSISCHQPCCITRLTHEDIKCETPLRCASECENTFTLHVTHRLSVYFPSLKCRSHNRVPSLPLTNIAKFTVSDLRERKKDLEHVRSALGYNGYSEICWQSRPNKLGKRQGRKRRKV